MPHSRHPSSAPFVLFVLSILFAAPSLAIETEEVSLGIDGNYDATVLIYRDANGGMVFIDNSVASPVTLSELNQGRDTHAQLLGLNADDHPQYFNAARHASAHTAAYNSALAIEPDMAGHTTLGAHLEDAAIHMNAAENETVSGDWIFTGSPEFRANLYLSNDGAAGDQSIRFEDGATDAELLWDDDAGLFAFNRDLKTSGQFAVGASAPLAPLHAEAAQAILRLSDSDSAAATQAQAYVEFYDRNVSRAGRIGFVDGNGELRIMNELVTSAGIRFSTAEGGTLYLSQPGALGVGTAAPFGSAEIAGVGATPNAIVNLSNINTSITSGAEIASVNFRGYDSSANAAGIGARIQAAADNTGHTDNSRDTALTFSTTSSTSLVEAMRISSDQRVNIGGDTTPDDLFTVGATSQFRINSSGVIAATGDGSHALTGSVLLNSDLRIESASATQSRIHHDDEDIFFLASDGTVSIELDEDNDSSSMLQVRAGGDVTVMTLNESGNMVLIGDLDVNGGDIATLSAAMQIDPNKSGNAALRLGNPSHSDTIEFHGLTDYLATMGNGSANPATDAPADWLEIKIGGTTRYVPVYN
jgi:hypothetical protein